MSIKTDSLYIDNFPALHAGLVGKDNWQIPVSGQWVPSITGEGATGTWNIDISGMADAAKKVSNSLTINNRGKEITFNGEKSATLIVNRRCSVGRSGAASDYSFYTEDGKLKGWQKVASIIFQPHHTDREIVFKVSRGISAHEYSGILRAHLRINDTTATASKLITQLIWEYANADVDPNKLMLIGTADTANNKIIGELWMNIGTASYGIYHFDVLQEHDRTVAGNVGYSELWTLYNRDGSKEEDWAYFEGTEGVLSAFATIKNTVSSANKLNTNAGSVDKPVYFANGIPIECNHSFSDYLSKSSGGEIEGFVIFKNIADFNTDVNFNSGTVDISGDLAVGGQASFLGETYFGTEDSKEIPVTFNCTTNFLHIVDFYNNVNFNGGISHGFMSLDKNGFILDTSAHFNQSIVLSEQTYGSECPEDGTEGQIFFVLIDE